MDKDILKMAIQKIENMQLEKDNIRNNLGFWDIFDLIDKEKYEPLYLDNIEDEAMYRKFNVFLDVCEEIIGNTLIHNSIGFHNFENEFVIIIEYKEYIYRLYMDVDYNGINTRIVRTCDKTMVYGSGNESDLIIPIHLTESIINSYVKYEEKPIEIKSLQFALNLFNGYKSMIGRKFSDSEEEMYDYIIKKLIKQEDC